MKRLASLFLMFILAIGMSGCADKASILFNQRPITKESVMDYTSVFKPGMRVYYLVLIPKTVKSQRITIQIIKKDNADERLGYKLYWTKTAKLKDEQMYYYDDYVVIYEPGAYVMQVYSKDYPTKRLCMAQFFIRE